ncbi:MAG: hypothetical protein H6765_08890 [Candidatus Peribacteria bacterium]|nr:MAG: hypothetical protein H6765_08890 [Candidatus Peribacteria bacterium]
MVQINNPVTVEVNGNAAQYTCDTSLYNALEYVDKRDDWGLVYPCVIANIPGDA